MLQAVVVDLAGTLTGFRWDDELWRRGVRALLAAAGAGAAEGERAARALRRRFVRDPADLAELDYARAVGDVLAELGVPAGADAVRRGIEAEYRAWAPARHVHPDAAALLDGIRARGLRTGVVANTFDPPRLFRADLDAAGIGPRADAIVLSCEVGVRLPHPAMYRTAAAALAVEPAAILVVTERTGERIAAPERLGMRTIAAGRRPLDLLDVIQGIVGSKTPGKI